MASNVTNPGRPAEATVNGATFAAEFAPLVGLTCLEPGGSPTGLLLAIDKTAAERRGVDQS